MKLKISLLFCISSAMILSGCQSGFVKKPDLGRLAFWKNENLRLAARKDNVPPPSAHFSPDPGQGSGTSGSDTKNALKSNIDQIIADANKSKTKTQDPIRKPYSLESIDPKLGNEKDKSNDFVLSEKLNQIQTRTNQAISKTNQAIGATENAIKQTGELVENTANTFSGWKNTLQDSTSNQVKQVANEFKSQASQAIATTNNSVNQLVDGTTSTINQTVSTVKNSLDNSFKPSNVISNPFVNNENGSQTKQLSPLGSDATKNGFVSKYKQAAKQFANNKAESTAPLAGNSVKQSSFDAAVKSPAASRPESSSANKYPSTSFGKFEPLNEDTEKDEFKIPPQLLRGSGSFSPGSTKPLRPVK